MKPAHAAGAIQALAAIGQKALQAGDGLIKLSQSAVGVDIMDEEGGAGSGNVVGGLRAESRK
ncbi:MAG: hypothetical protein ACR2J1_11875 [Methyloceanibacter sp.]|uniref:hypothetical protein n=1 Tax=Methyloceanibacter sp. TaxID=1965321 RepID=UPI003D9AED2D